MSNLVIKNRISDSSASALKSSYSKHSSYFIKINLMCYGKIINCAIFSKDKILFNNGDREFSNLISFIAKTTNPKFTNEDYKLGSRNRYLIYRNGLTFLCQADDVSNSDIFCFLEELQNEVDTSEGINKDEISILIRDFNRASRRKFFNFCNTRSTNLNSSCQIM